MSLVNRIKMLCAKQHISLHRLEMTIGFSKSSISKWDVNAPSVEKVLRVAEYFNAALPLPPTAFFLALCRRKSMRSFQNIWLSSVPKSSSSLLWLKPQPFCIKKTAPFRAVFFIFFRAKSSSLNRSTHIRIQSWRLGPIPGRYTAPGLSRS